MGPPIILRTSPLPPGAEAPSSDDYSDVPAGPKTYLTTKVSRPADPHQVCRRVSDGDHVCRAAGYSVHVVSVSRMTPTVLPGHSGRAKGNDIPPEDSLSHDAAHEHRSSRLSIR